MRDTVKEAQTQKGARIREGMSSFGDFTKGVLDLVVVGAQAAAAYILYFNQSNALKVIALILAVNASLKALDKFTK